uniref:RING-type E3 ubiquitin transferase n=1 Tax=Leersia perrieri TaxID=77586 RepID=A0A0D9VV02_9ORYZ
MAGAAVVLGAAAAAAAATAVLALTTTTTSAPADRRGAGECVDDSTVAPRECAVCLSELAGAAVRTLPGCGHGFHEECIGRWLPLRAECPLCRRPVPVEVGVAEAEPAAWTSSSTSRAARTMACAFGDGRVVWTRSPSSSVQEL